MLLHAFGDTIGYYNGEWEFNHYEEKITTSISDYLLFEFIELGGINQIDFSTWKVSDDTIMHLDTAKILVQDFKNINEFGNKLTKQYVSNLEELEKRHIGKTVKKSLIQLQHGTPWTKLRYDTFSGGNGAAMRTACLGLLYHGKINRKRLIILSLEASRITHNSAIGFLGGINTALFTAYAIEGIHPSKWPYKMLKDIESGIIENYLQTTRGLEEYNRDKNQFLDPWKKYIEKRFDDKMRFTKQRFMQVPSVRSKFFLDNFVPKEFGTNIVGTNGADVNIIAYDALMDAMIGQNDICWEKFIVYSAIHYGDSDSTGAIAGAFYGAYFGRKHVPESNLKNLEFKKDLITVAEKLFAKYQKSQKSSRNNTSRLT